MQEYSFFKVAKLLLFAPDQLRAKLDKVDLGRYSKDEGYIKILGVKSGWWYLALAIWLITAGLIAVFNLPLYFIDAFWGKLPIRWSSSFFMNYWLVLKASFIPLAVFCFLGFLADVYYTEESNYGKGKGKDPLILWIIIFAGTINCFLSIWNAFLVFSIFYWTALLMRGLYFSGSALKNVAVFFQGIILISVAAVWIIIAIAVHNMENSTYFLAGFPWWIPIIIGTVLFTAILYCLKFIKREETHKNLLLNGILQFGFITLSFLSLWLFSLLFDYQFGSLANTGNTILIGVGIWCLTYFRLWSWLWLSAEALFKPTQLSEILVKDKNLIFPPLVMKQTLLKSAEANPSKTLAIGSYIMLNQGWISLGNRCINTVIKAFPEKEEELGNKRSFLMQKMTQDIGLN